MFGGGVDESNDSRVIAGDGESSFLLPGAASIHLGRVRFQLRNFLDSDEMEEPSRVILFVVLMTFVVVCCD